MSYEIEAVTADCYPGSSVLINKFDIRDQVKLAEVESVLVSARFVQWLKKPGMNSFDFPHYKAIHRFLFSDLYSWSGETRTINFTKKGTRFCPVDEIDRRASEIFGRLRSKNYLTGLPHDRFVEELTDLYCVTNELHPFREGNGRTQRAFLTQLIRNAGYDINFGDIDTDLLMLATIQAAGGVIDLLLSILQDAVQ